MLIVENEDFDDPPPLIDPEDKDSSAITSNCTSLEPQPDHQFLALSPAALLGLASLKALRITGYINGYAIKILVDSSSTHNIIQPRVASFLNIEVSPVDSFPVMIGNGELIHCVGICNNVSLTLGKHPLSIPLFVLPIEGADVVLGIAWLSTLGTIHADFSIPSLSFFREGQTITLTGEPLTTPATPSNINHLLLHGAVSSLHTMIFQHTPDTSEPHAEIHPDPIIQSLLETYQDIFQPPTSLPPPRNHDHHIHLKPNSNPVNVRPYRYPHYQKAIITTLIREMLKDGFIQPSTSPYSSPVLLVRKKDGT